MCRFARLRSLPVQHAGTRSGPGGRHSSLRICDRSIAVANARSPAVLGHVRHATLPTLGLPFQCVATLAYYSGSSLKLAAPSRRTYSQTLARDIDSALAAETVAMAIDTKDTDVKPVDILNEDGALSAGRAEASLDPESDEDVPVEADELKDALGRPPPVNSSYLPLPWKGRLGYVSHALLDKDDDVFAKPEC